MDDVREAFHQHREYIVTCMLEGQEGLDWEKSAIFNYIKHKFPVGAIEQSFIHLLIFHVGTRPNGAVKNGAHQRPRSS